MPWHIEKRDTAFHVIKDADDSSVSSFDNRPDAIKQLRTLYASDDVVAASFHMGEHPMNTADVPPQDMDCPPGHHKMPNGQCMKNGDMADVPMPAYKTWPWEGVLTVEGIESGDSRKFSAGSLVWDLGGEDGLPLMWQKVTSHGGTGDVSVRVGKINHVWREPDPAGRQDVFTIKARGLIDLENEDGKEAYRRMKAKMMSGNSVDVDSVKDANVELVYDDPVTMANGEGASPISVMAKPSLTIYHKGRIRGTTLVEYPAFTEARLSLMDEGMHESEDGLTELVASLGFTEDDALVGEERHDRIAAALREHGIESESYETVSDRMSAITAASTSITFNDLPPREWFQEPTDVSPLGALTITDKGRVYGFVAPADVRHRSFPGKMQYAPRKKVDYGRFMSGETIVADGGRVSTGPITMNCGHATTAYSLTAVQAQEHYDNSCAILASVVVGETKEGATWFAGALLKDVEPAQVQRAMACKLSGDWRAHLDKPGWRELTAALLVPVPGFPMARVAPSVRMEEGQLVSSAVPVRFIHDDEEPVVAASIPVTANITNRVAALKLRVKTFRFDPHQKCDVPSADVDDVMLDDEQLDLTPEMTSAAFVRFADINTKTRNALAAKGQALPDGSYPIRNVSDLHNAIQAYGRSKPDDRVKVRRHIMKRAKQLNSYDVIPKEWTTAEARNAIVMRIQKSIGHDPATRVAALRSRVITSGSQNGDTISLMDTFGFDPKQARDSHGRWSRGDKVYLHPKSEGGMRMGDRGKPHTVADTSGEKARVTRSTASGHSESHVPHEHLLTKKEYENTPGNVHEIRDADSHADRNGPTAADNKRRLAELDAKAEGDEGLSGAEASERSQLRKTLKMTQTDTGGSISREDAARIMHGDHLKARQDVRIKNATKERVASDRAETKRQQEIMKGAPSAKKSIDQIHPFPTILPRWVTDAETGQEYDTHSGVKLPIWVEDEYGRQLDTRTMKRAKG